MNLEKTVQSLTKKGYQVSVFKTGKEAAAYLDQKVDGKSVGFGDSET